MKSLIFYLSVVLAVVAASKKEKRGLLHALHQANDQYSAHSSFGHFHHSNNNGFTRHIAPTSFSTFLHQPLQTTTQAPPAPPVQLSPQPPTSHQIFIQSAPPQPQQQPLPQPQQPNPNQYIVGPQVQTVHQETHYPTQIHTIHIVPAQPRFGTQPIAQPSQTPQIYNQPTQQQNPSYNPMQSVSYQQPMYSILPTIVQTTLQKVSFPLNIPQRAAQQPSQPAPLQPQQPQFQLAQPGTTYIQSPDQPQTFTFNAPYPETNFDAYGPTVLSTRISHPQQFSTGSVGTVNGSPTYSW